MINLININQEFPILTKKINNQNLVYLDNAATTQKPQVVINAISDYYQRFNANIHRGVHSLSDGSTQIWADSRQIITDFFSASPEELIITQNATQSINAVAYGWGQQQLQKDDVVLTTLMEHHANIVPWQRLCRNAGAKLVFVGLDDQARIDIKDLQEKLLQYKNRIKLVTFTHISNVTGVVNPFEKILQLIKEVCPKAKSLIDGAQAVAHLPVNFTKMGADFYVFSGHKMYGPMGVGGLLVKKTLIKSGEFQPWLFGGGMIAEVSRDNTTFSDDLQEKFTAGTPDVASIVGLSEAIKFLQQLTMSNIEEHSSDLVGYAMTKLKNNKSIQIIGPDDKERIGSVAFAYQGVHAHDVAQILDSEGVAVRSGHHCCMPLHKHFNWQATVRASFAVYNTREDIDKLVESLGKVAEIFSK